MFYTKNCRNSDHVIGYMTGVCACNLNRIFLYSTLKAIQLNILHYIFTNYEFEFG